MRKESSNLTLTSTNTLNNIRGSSALIGQPNNKTRPQTSNVIRSVITNEDIEDLQKRLLISI